MAKNKNYWVKVPKFKKKNIHLLPKMDQNVLVTLQEWENRRSLDNTIFFLMPEEYYRFLLNDM